MNILITLMVAASGLCLLWIVQSIVLKIAGEPLAWPLRFKTRKPLVKWTSRIMIHTNWIIILIGAPLATGTSTLEWLHQAFPTPIPYRDIAIVISLMLFPAWIMYGFWYVAGWIRFEPQGETKTRRWKLFRRFIGPWPLATLEEAVFRGVLLEQLLRSLPQSKGFTALAIIVSSAVFSSIHFVKAANSSRRVWQPAYGLFIVSCLFGLAYVVGGRSLWLPIGIHAAAVLAIEVMRLYVVFVAPPWLIGYAEFPQSGVIGTIFVACVAIAMVVLI